MPKLCWGYVWALLFCGLASPFIRADTSESTGNQAREMALYLSQHGYVLAKVEMLGSYPTLHAEINGEDAYLGIDTGEMTELGNHPSPGFKLDIHDSDQKDWWLGGPYASNTRTAMINSFTINGVAINRTNPIRIYSRSGPHVVSSGCRFGYDYLHYNEAILPIASPIFMFKPGTGPPVPIDRFMTAMGYSQIPIAYSETGPLVRGNLNGKPLVALLNSGARRSLFDLDYVKTVGGTVEATGGAYTTGHELDIDFHGYLPDSLGFGSVKIDPKVMSACNSPYFAHIGCNMLLGYDILSEHQAVIDFGTNTLWMK